MYVYIHIRSLKGLNTYVKTSLPYPATAVKHRVAKSLAGFSGAIQFAPKHMANAEIMNPRMMG